ncbi:MAG: LPS-assembly protein LptD [Bdellovibrionales bacterium]|nr:LPS-assembly protein LptD [Bdellovibrionales bacterium]
MLSVAWLAFGTAPVRAEPPEETKARVADGTPRAGASDVHDSDKQPLHWSSEKTIWDRKNNLVTLIGTAKVSQPGETIDADRIVLDLNARTLDAVGRVHYRASDTLIEAREMHFNLDTRTGTIVGGRVTNGKFLLVGERINKLGEGRYQTHEAEYTTCRDCPGSWSFTGNDVDLEFEGYAYMSDVTANVKGTPVFWMPYAILPIKSKRQTGLLFPRIGTSDLHGFRFVQPFFLTLGRSGDMTLGAGVFSERGPRLEWEGRYVHSSTGWGTANVFYTRDTKDGAPTGNRWAGRLRQAHRLPWGVDYKLRILEVSDNLYPVQFGSEDGIPGRREPVLQSDVSLSKQAPGISAQVSARRYRNLLNFDEPTEFDPKTVQVFPRAAVSLNDTRPFDGPLSLGLNLTLDNFMRGAGAFDHDFCDSGPCPSIDDPFTPGTDPVREATRVAVTPSLYTTMRLWDVLSIVPSAEYRSYLYDFHGELPSLNRGYLRLRADASLAFERVYATSNPEIPHVKHVVRPYLSYSRIPVVNEPDHPFIDQVRYRNGYAFDNQDLVPFGRSPSLVNYFVPQGNSLTYALSTQLIRKRVYEGLAPTYQPFVELRGGQTVDFLELEKAEDEQVPFSRFEAYLVLRLDRLTAASQYYYYPGLDRLLDTPDNEVLDRSPHTVSSSLSYTIDSAIHQEILRFERTVSLSHTWNRVNGNTHNLGTALRYSLNDHWMPSVKTAYDLINSRFIEVSAGLLWQPPGRCFRLALGLSRTVDRKEDFSIDFTLNLTGEGFDDVGSVIGL